MWRCPEPGQRIPDVRSISPPQHRTDVGRLVTGTPVRPARPADQGTGQGSVRVRVTSAARDRRSQDTKPSRPLPARAMSAIGTLLEMGDGNEYRQAGNGEHGIRAQAA